MNEIVVFLAIVVVGGVFIAHRNGAFSRDDGSPELRRRVWMAPESHAADAYLDARPGWAERHARGTSSGPSE